MNEISKLNTGNAEGRKGRRRSKKGKKKGMKLLERQEARQEVCMRKDNHK